MKDYQFYYILFFLATIAGNTAKHWLPAGGFLLMALIYFCLALGGRK